MSYYLTQGAGHSVNQEEAMTTTLEDRTKERHEQRSAGGGSLVSTVAGRMSGLASWRVWIVSASAFAAFAGLFFGSSMPFAIPQVESACGQAPPDVRFTSSSSEVSSFLDACGAVGRDAYQSMQMADLLYPLVFGLFLATSLALAVTHLAPRHQSVLALAALPLVGTVFDYLENVFAWLALAAYPEPSATGSLLGLASAAKTTTFWIAGIVLLGALGALAVVEGRRLLRHRAVTLGAGAADTPNTSEGK
jgi:hypothetical protein